MYVNKKARLVKSFDEIRSRLTGSGWKIESGPCDNALWEGNLMDVPSTMTSAPYKMCSSLRHGRFWHWECRRMLLHAPL